MRSLRRGDGQPSAEVKIQRGWELLAHDSGEKLEEKGGGVGGVGVERR